MSAIISTSFFSFSGGTGETPYVFAEIPTVEQYVREYYDEVPVLAKIAWCESRNRQFSPSGDIFRGETNSADIGVMQINERFHLKTAKKLGYNLYSLEGNLAYARYLFEKEGTTPWLSSSKCWGKENHIARS